jgi:hypothetical protein
MIARPPLPHDRDPEYIAKSLTFATSPSFWFCPLQPTTSLWMLKKRPFMMKHMPKHMTKVYGNANDWGCTDRQVNIRLQGVEILRVVAQRFRGKERRRIINSRIDLQARRQTGLGNAN